MLPIETPGKIICVGLNYRSHAEESGFPIPDQPVIFAKWGNSLIGPGEPIVVPSVTKEVDFEAELGVIIGERVRGIAKKNALEAVRGYLCVNDVSARDLQKADRQWSRGKSLDTFCPVGPRLVPADDVLDPHDLRVRAIVDGVVLQDASTSDMIFGIDELIAFISQAITLEPGDLIATGTPAGVGMFHDPPVFLVDGSSVTVEIEGLGELTNPVVAAA